MRRLSACAAAVSAIQTCLAFQAASPTPYHRVLLPLQTPSPSAQLAESPGEDRGAPVVSRCSRRDALLRSASAIAAAAVLVTGSEEAQADNDGVVTPSGMGDGDDSVEPTKSSGASEGGGVVMYKTKSGLKYVELREGTGPMPRYGQLVSISYKAYVKLPDIKGQTQKPVEFDSDRAYLVKHGNGRALAGLDEGLHTMRVGGSRRIIIPPKLGYVQPGLGPIPPGPFARRKLNSLLDKMVEVRGGNVIFDVELRSTMDDETDQGYYEDGSISPEDFNTLRKNLQNAGIDARGAGFRELQPESV